MKIKFTDLLNNYQDDTINIKEKSITNPKKILKLTGVKSKTNITMTKRSLSILLASAVLMMSGVTVYAVESGAIDSFISYFNNERYTPYSYSGSYNDVIDYSTFIKNNINTNVEVSNIQCSNENISIDFQGTICDASNVYIVANLILPEGANFIPKDGCSSFENCKFYSADNNVNYFLSSWGCDVINDDNINDNIVPICITSSFNNTFDYNGEYIVEISNLATPIYNDKTDEIKFDVQEEFDMSFNIYLENNDFVREVNNIDKKFTINDGSIATITSIKYSPLSLNINVDTDWKPYDINDDGIVSNDENINCYEDGSIYLRENYINVYFIYSDGRKVLANRDIKRLAVDKDENLTCIIYNYGESMIDLVDYTNVVSIEVNGTVIPIK